MLIVNPRRAACFFRKYIAQDIEEFWIAALNSRKIVTAKSCLFRGTVDHCLFHPRDVFRFACQYNAASFVVAHNHPSGDVSPSHEDIQVTEQLLTLSIILEIPFVDHLIISRSAYFSFMESGRLRIVKQKIDMS